MASPYFGEGTLMELKRSALRAQSQAKKVVENIDKGVDAVQEGAEVAAAAFAFGLANGRVGGGGLKVPLIGMPADLVFGLGMHLVTFIGGVREERARHYRAFANGALGSYFSTLGAQVGNQWLPKKLQALAGEETTGGAALADEELARMVRPA